jgi:hypothetical protein
MARGRPSGQEGEGMTLPEPSRNRQVFARGAQLFAATLFVLTPTLLCIGALPALGGQILLAQNATTDSGTTAQGTGTAAGASTGDVNANTSAAGVNANTSAAAEGGVNANTSAAGAAEEQPQVPKQPAVETTPFGLTIYRGSGSP